jgi:ribosomal protein S18 acetylase RimI-like enzyme
MIQYFTTNIVASSHPTRKIGIRASLLSEFLFTIPLRTPMSIQVLNLQSDSIAQRVLAIQQASYAIEAELIGTQNIPPLHDTVESLQKTEELFYGYWVDETIAGLIAITYEDGTLDICRMAVHPDYFRRRIASALLTFALSAHPDATRTIVATGARNDPAKQLYLRHGFTQTGEQEVEPGVLIAFFEKVID